MPSEKDMCNPAKMQEYMLQMGEYSARQQLKLASIETEARDAPPRARARHAHERCARASPQFHRTRARPRYRASHKIRLRPRLRSLQNPTRGGGPASRWDGVLRFQAWQGEAWASRFECARDGACPKPKLGGRAGDLSRGHAFFVWAGACCESGIDHTCLIFVGSGFAGASAGAKERNEMKASEYRDRAWLANS
eukprot:5567878-Pleurochrysis_carterae.AAC.1